MENKKQIESKVEERNIEKSEIIYVCARKLLFRTIYRTLDEFSRCQTIKLSTKSEESIFTTYNFWLSFTPNSPHALGAFYF